MVFLRVSRSPKIRIHVCMHIWIGNYICIYLFIYVRYMYIIVYVLYVYINIYIYVRYAYIIIFLWSVLLTKGTNICIYTYMYISLFMYRCITYVSIYT